MLCIYKTYAQYGDQKAISVPISAYQNATALIHLPDDYSTNTTIKHPLIVGFPGSGESGNDPFSLTVEGLGHAIYANQWNGNAVNPETKDTEKFIAISMLPPSSTTGISFSQIDYALTWIYAHYRVDTNCVALTGLSRGGGTTVYYPSHISYVNFTDHYIYQYTTPSHLLAAIIPMSAENNQNDPVNFLVTDSVNVWAFGSDTAVGSSDPHGVSTHFFANHINAIAPLARFTNYVGGHCCWAQFYDDSYKEVIDGSSMNIYQFILYHRRGNANHLKGSINTGKITGSPFCVTNSAGAVISVPFTATGTLNKGNIYRAQLSAVSGLFVPITTIGKLHSTAKSGTITAIIPAGTVTGNVYHIRVSSSDPHITGIKSTSTITVNLSSNNITPTADQNITANKKGKKLAVTEQPSPLSRNWMYGTKLGNYNTSLATTGTTYKPDFSSAGTYYVVCKSLYSCGTIISNPVKIIVSSSLMGSDDPEQITAQQIQFSAQQLEGYIHCNYFVTKKGKVAITIYDEYGRAYASFNETRNAGSYTHSFMQQFKPGLYFIVFQGDQKKISQKILVLD